MNPIIFVCFLEAIYKRYGIPVLSREWVLDCVSEYELKPVEEYLLSTEIVCESDGEDSKSDLDEVSSEN